MTAPWACHPKRHVVAAGPVSPTFREKRERWGTRPNRYFIFMAGMGMSELKMSH